MSMFWVACLGANGKGAAHVLANRRDVLVGSNLGAPHLAWAKNLYSALENWPAANVLILGCWPAASQPIDEFRLASLLKFRGPLPVRLFNGKEAVVLGWRQANAWDGLALRLLIGGKVEHGWDAATIASVAPATGRKRLYREGHLFEILNECDHPILGHVTHVRHETGELRGVEGFLYS